MPWKIPALPSLQALAGYEKYLFALLIFIVGWMVARRLGRLFQGLAIRHLSRQHAMLVGRGATYLLILLVAFEALNLAGVDVSVLLGAAGVLTIALGFAAQTATSNLISGLFLMAERPFVLGDTIQSGTAFGEVISIDLLSVKIRTFDNILLRLPNEALLKADIANWTRLPIRRIDFDMTFPFSADPRRIQSILEVVAEANELCLDEPRTTFFFRSFDPSGFQARFGVWTSTSHFIEAKNRFFIEMMEALRENGVDFAYPRRELSAIEPLTVRVTTEKQAEHGLIGG